MLTSTWQLNPPVNNTAKIEECVKFSERIQSDSRICIRVNNPSNPPPPPTPHPPHTHSSE